jgi:hypothetical protein
VPRTVLLVSSAVISTVSPGSAPKIDTLKFSNGTVNTTVKSPSHLDPDESSEQNAKRVNAKTRAFPIGACECGANKCHCGRKRRKCRDRRKIQHDGLHNGG